MWEVALKSTYLCVRSQFCTAQNHTFFKTWKLVPLNIERKHLQHYSVIFLTYNHLDPHQSIHNHILINHQTSIDRKYDTSIYSLDCHWIIGEQREMGQGHYNWLLGVLKMFTKNIQGNDRIPCRLTCFKISLFLNIFYYKCVETKSLLI